MICMLLGIVACVFALLRAFVRKKRIDDPTGRERGYHRAGGMWINKEGDIVDENSEGKRQLRKIFFIIPTFFSN